MNPTAVICHNCQTDVAETLSAEARVRARGKVRDCLAGYLDLSDDALEEVAEAVMDSLSNTYW